MNRQRSSKGWRGALALVAKALAEGGEEEQQAAILEHIQGALREGYRCVVTPPRRRRFGTVTSFTETAMCSSR
jgi:hypothetical protein